MSDTISDREVVLLACSDLAGVSGESIKRFTSKDWRTKVEGPARARRMPLTDLVTFEAADLSARLGLSTEDGMRLQRLFDRRVRLAFELERLAREGIWAVTLGEPGYPLELREKLGMHAPAVLFGAGDLESTAISGLGVVGSRDADAAALEFAQAAGTQAANQRWATVSGGARGVDRAAMSGAWDAGGVVLVAVAEGVGRTLRDASVRAAIREGRAVVVSPFRPDAQFTVGNAMGRNRIIYGLATLTVVVASAVDEGGTWAGAVEAITHGWGPVYVRDDDDAPAGNAALIGNGGRPIGLDDLASLPALASVPKRRPATVAAEQATLFEESTTAPRR